MAGARRCTSPQHFSQTFLHVNGRLQVTQILLGRFSFFTPRGMLLSGKSLRRSASTTLCGCDADVAHGRNAVCKNSPISKQNFLEVVMKRKIDGHA